MRLIVHRDFKIYVSDFACGQTLVVELHETSPGRWRPLQVCFIIQAYYMYFNSEII